MTLQEFGASTSSPRRRVAAAEMPSVSSSTPSGRTTIPLTEFHVAVADVTNEQHQNMTDLVQLSDFNAEVIVRFLRDNGIDAHVDEATDGFRYALADPAREEHVRFACVCLRASISYAIEAAYWCMEAKR